MKTNLMYDMYVPTRVMFGVGMLNRLSEQPLPSPSENGRFGVYHIG